MKLKNLYNKKIAILGLGIENQAMLRYLLKKKVKAEFTICDARDKKQLGEKYKEFGKHENVGWRLGKEFNRNLFEFDILFRSPGWPLFCPGITEAVKSHCVEPHCNAALRRKNTPLAKGGRGVTVYSPMRLFMDLCPTKKIIGVTGTKGKGTISTLIHSILKEAGKKVYLGGNIGVAPFAFLEKLEKKDWVVLELSSFQLEDMTESPHIGVIINLYREHLAPADPLNPNYHKSVNAYWQAKLNLGRYQCHHDFLVLNRRFKELGVKYLKTVKGFSGTRVYFGPSKLKSKLLGEHNQENIGAAVEVAKIIGIKDKFIKDAVAKYRGLEHRIEFVKEVKGVKFYNDSFATTPEASITALKSFAQPVVLLAGGADKGANFRVFAREIKKRVKFLVLLDGQATLRLKKDLLAVGFPSAKMKIVYSIKEAMKLAKTKAVKGDIILLSTACASFGMFKNYKERGALFKKNV